MAAEIYCLCDGENGVLVKEYEKMTVLTNQPVKCIKTGAKRMISYIKDEPDNDKSEMWQYSNVDVSECPSCKRLIAKG